MNITLIRHGKTPGNEKKQYIGVTDEPLSEAGLRELREFAARGRYPAAERLYASPMRRCVETAGIIYPGRTPVIVQDLREMDFGRFERLSYDDIARRPGHERFGFDERGFFFPGGEDVADFTARVVAAYTALGEPEDAVFVVHGGVIMAIMHSLFGGDSYDYQVENGCGYTVRGYGENLKWDKL